MEDQQPATGDLSDDVSGDTSEQAASVDTDASESDTDAAESSSEPEASDAESTGDDADAVVGFKTRRPAGRRLFVAAAVAAALFVGSAAFAGATVQPYLTDRAVVATKLRIVETAANAITTLWTYNPDNMDKLADRAARYLSGDFEAQYRKYIDAIAPTNKQAQITNTTQVTGAAVESLTATDATAIVYTNTTSTSPLTKNIPSLKYLSYRLNLKRDRARWLVTKMTTITSLDLTPQLG